MYVVGKYFYQQNFYQNDSHGSISIHGNVFIIRNISIFEISTMKCL